MQACHAALEHAYEHGRPSDWHPSYVTLTARDRPALERLRAELNASSIPTAEFHEPYKDWGLTAISCLLTEEQRGALSHLPLWRPHTTEETT